MFLDAEKAQRVASCSLCRGPMQQPVWTRCGQGCCEGCLRRWHERERRCPKCESVFPTVNDNINLDLERQQQVDDLEVMCPHGVRGSPSGTEGGPHTRCDWKGRFAGLSKHLQEDCKMEELKCKNLGCTFIGARSLWTSHSEKCLFRPVKCPHCTESFPIMDKQTHEDVCLERIVPCLLNCGLDMKRREYALHRRKDCVNNYTNLHVKGFAPTMVESELEALFKPFGEIITHRLVAATEKDKVIHQPYGFVCYRTPEAAHAAEHGLNETVHNKRTLRLARAETPRNLWQQCRARFPDCCVYIRNLPHDVTEAQLVKAYAEVGFVLTAHVVMYRIEDPLTRTPKDVAKGTAYVCFSLATEADAAITFSEHNLLFKQPINAKKYVPEEAKKGPWDKSSYHPRQYQQPSEPYTRSGGYYSPNPLQAYPQYSALYSPHQAQWQWVCCYAS